MEQPLVSVVTITRNRGNLLKRCISSVLSQTYKNFEHIVVDGASDDNTDEVIASFRDERLKYVKLNSNWAIKDTLDHGVSLCSGKYITFLDSDDEYLPQKIEKQVKLIESLPEDYGFVYCWMTYFDSSNNNSFLRLHNPQIRGFAGDEVIGRPIITGTPTLMFRSTFFRRFGGWKSVDEIGIGSDWEMCTRACQLCKIDYVSESLVNVYINHGSVRQSGPAYYDNIYERTIKFHTYFLNTYKDKFDKKPKLKFYHYWMMFLTGITCNHPLEACGYFLKALKSNPKMLVKSIVEKIKT